MVPASSDLPDDVDAAQRALIDWYETRDRSVPWRDSRDPYEIMVAEVMSQQTQLERVGPAWAAFLERWPDVDALARASRADVIAFWSDHALGYNRRAGYLHSASRHIVDQWEGTIPEDPSALESLNGIGPYTANAIASLAFNAGGAVVDTNVRRVLYRVLQPADEEPAYEEVANEFMPTGRSRVWNNAIMDLGALVCTPTPACDGEDCPLRSWCGAYATGDFRAPDVPTQPSFEGSRRQYRGRILRALSNHGSLDVDALGSLIHEEYGAADWDRSWLAGLLDDLEGEGLVHQRTDGSYTLGDPSG